MFGRVKCLYRVNILEKLEASEEINLMYRAPGRKDHQNLPEILDEIFNRLDNLTERLTYLEKQL